MHRRTENALVGWWLCAGDSEGAVYRRRFFEKQKGGRGGLVERLRAIRPVSQKGIERQTDGQTIEGLEKEWKKQREPL